MSNKRRKMHKNIAQNDFIYFPDKNLWDVSYPVFKDEFETNELYAKIRRMRLANSREKGVGVAAIQVGIRDRMFYYKVPEMGEGVMINPRIVGTSGEYVSMQEGCLSMRGYYWDVTRPSEVTVQWQDQFGSEYQSNVDGLMARLVQHEIDHLDGKLLVDFLSEDDYDKFEDAFFNQGQRSDFGPMIIEPTPSVFDD